MNRDDENEFQYLVKVVEEIIKLKNFTKNTSNAHGKTGSFTLKFHMRAPVLKDIEKLGTLNDLSFQLTEEYIAQIKNTKRKTTERQYSKSEE